MGVGAVSGGGGIRGGAVLGGVGAVSGWVGAVRPYPANNRNSPVHN